MNKAVFLDRDGIINHTIIRQGKARAPYSMDEFRFIEGSKDAIELLKHNGFLLIVVTNQPDVSRGWVERAQVDLVNSHVRNYLPVDDIKACFHDNQDNCPCRKPKPGMLLEAALERDIDLGASFMIGDRYSDAKAGQSAGCKSILVGPGDSEAQGDISPDFHCDTLMAAVDWILKRS